MKKWNAWKLRLATGLAGLITSAPDEDPKLPLAKDLLNDRSGSIPKVVEWKLVVAGILAAHEKNLTSVMIRIEGGDIAESIGFALEEFGYDTMCYFVDGKREIRNLEVKWRKKAHLHPKQLAKA